MATGTAPLPAASLVGALLNRRYRLTRPLGQGGMGLVYAGHVEGTNQNVAVKLLRAEFIDDPDVVTRFTDEAKIAARIIHPNVMRIFDVQRAEDGTPYLVMELLDGQPLASVMKTHSRLPVNQASEILQAVLAGLSAAHAHGIVHRDLKPDNVFVGGGGTKLLDFGIAKVMDAAGGMGNPTKTGMLLGTPAYMAPEQIRNAKDVDARADLWSAGVMFYEMITGRQAFPAPTEFARLAAVLGTQPDPIVSIDPSLAPWAAFVERALAKDRNQRFHSAQEMSHALSHAAHAPPSNVPATPVVMPAPARTSSMPPPPVLPFAGTLPAGGVVIPPVQIPGTMPGFESTKPSAGADRASNVPVSGTLSSSPSPHRGSGIPEIPIVGSEDIERKSGISPMVVALLVILALGAGFLMGYAVARAT
jgi:serine/threonine-protein kinase